MSMRRTLFALIAGTIIAGSPAKADENTTVTIFKNPWCGCCGAWSEALEKAGYKIVLHDMDDLSTIKKQAGVSEKLAACHTAFIGDQRKYTLEGHVPLEAIDKLMTERPDIKGIAVPGMPQGSLGMGDQQGASYDVIAFGGEGTEEGAVYYQVRP